MHRLFDPGESLVPSFLAFLAWARQARTRAENLLKHPLRAQLLDAIERCPGIRLVELCRRVGMRRGTVQYHLFWLRRSRLIDSFSSGKARRFYAPRIGSQEARQRGLLRERASRNLAHRILDKPGILQKDLVTESGLNRKRVRGYAQLLQAESLLEIHGTRRERRYLPTDDLRRVFAEEDEWGNRDAAPPEPQAASESARRRRPSNPGGEPGEPSK